MIETSVPLETEAELYRTAFYHRITTFPPPTRIERVETPKAPPKIVCYRCGGVGHASNTCTAPLPELAELEAALESDAAKAAALIELNGSYARDDFGCFAKPVMGSIEIPTEQRVNGVTEKVSWETQSFCLNCGEPGHTFSRCSHVGVPQLMHELDVVIKQAEKGAGDDRIYQRFREMW